MKKLTCLFLITILPGLAAAAAPAFSEQSSVPIVRVCILDDRDSVILDSRSKYTVTAIDSQKVLMKGSYFPVKITPDKNGLALGGKSVDAAAVTISADDGADIAIDKRTFRGSVDIVKNGGGKLTVINRVPVEAYLYSVLRHEVSPHWPLECLKAQAIVARTFALYQARISKARPYDMTSDIYSQVYGGSASEKWPGSRTCHLLCL